MMKLQAVYLDAWETFRLLYGGQRSRLRNDPYLGLKVLFVALYERLVKRVIDRGAVQRSIQQDAIVISPFG